ncbi:hypothetical protein GQ649_26255 [Rhodococcus sp. DSM 6344]|nr:hypothetical protein [Rhodococcus erythropolis]
MALERSAIGWQQYISRVLGCKPGQLTYQLEECIEKIEALKPRTVNSATDLDALPVGSVVWTPALVGPVGHIFVKCAGMWIIPWHDAAEDPLEQNGSVTVIFTPGDAG